MRWPKYEAYVLVRSFSPYGEGYELLQVLSTGIWETENPNKHYDQILKSMEGEVYGSKREIEEEIYELAGTRSIDIDIEDDDDDW